MENRLPLRAVVWEDEKLGGRLEKTRDGDGNGNVYAENEIAELEEKAVFPCTG